MPLFNISHDVEEKEENDEDEEEELAFCAK